MPRSMPGPTTEDEPDEGPLRSQAPPYRGFKRVLLRVAGIHLEDMVEPAESTLFATIGFAVCFFGVYALVAYYAFFSRIGITHLGTGTQGPALAILGSTVIASLVMAFDRVLVSYVPNPRPPRRWSRSRGGASSRRRPRAFVLPLLGRLAIALLIGFFATQTIENFVFRKEITDQRVSDRKTELQGRVAAAKKARHKDFVAYKRELNLANERVDAARTKLHNSQEGQHGQCRPGTTCATDKEDYNRAVGQRDDVKSAWRSGSSDANALNDARVALSEFDDEPTAHLPKRGGALTDVQDLYSYLGKHKLAWVYYGGFMGLLLLFDLIAILLKYSLGRHTSYEDRQLENRAARREIHQAVIASRKQQGLDRIATHKRARAAQEEEVRKAFDDALRTEDVRQATHAHVESSLLGWIRRRGSEPDDQSEPEPGTDTDGPATQSLQGPAPTTEQEITGRPALIFQLLGVSAGVVVVAYAVGGLYTWSQLHHADLPTDGLWIMPAQQVLLTGSGLLAVGFLGIVLLSFGSQWLLRRLGLPIGSRRVLRTPVSADVGAGATLTLSALVAGLSVEDGWIGLGLFSEVGVLAVLLVIVLIAIQTLVQSTGRTRVGALVVTGFMALVAIVGMGSVRPLKLATADVWLAPGATCVRGSFLAHDNGGTYVVDPSHRQFRFLPDSTVLRYTLSKRRAPVSRIPYRTCPPTKV